MVNFFYLDPAMDGVNQWPMISEGHASARTEFVYNIDEIVNNSAIRYMCTLIECFHIFFQGYFNTNRIMNIFFKSYTPRPTYNFNFF